MNDFCENTVIQPGKIICKGPALCPDDDTMPYPRVCAHRGFRSIAPENSMPAFGAAIASGADEIEFDLWYTSDGEIVSIHDSKLDRVSDGTGKIYEHTYGELLNLDFGIKKSDTFAGLRILKFEDILAKFAGLCVMNIHVKTPGDQGEYDPALLKKMLSLIESYGVTDRCYLMSGNDAFQRQVGRVAPHIRRCQGAGPDPLKGQIVERAIENGCYKLQLFKPWINRDMIDKAHANGILCNVFYSDDPAECREFLNMGVDTVLTNDFLRIKNAVGAFLSEKA
ncbi:MAG: hypothetical protein MJ137_09565 [Clostridia bacterium]|nr:hypothetical protein [Clostridia bacterium]